MKSITYRLARWTMTLAMGTLLCGAGQAGVVMVSQGPKAAGDLYVSADTTQNAESFALATASSLSAFQWWGSDIDVGRFTVRFYVNGLTDVDGFTTLTGSGAQLTKADSGDVGLCFDPQVGQPVACNLQAYTLTLANAISTLANREYFLAVHADVDAVWGWQESAQGDASSYFRGADGTSWNSLAPDLSLAVIGDPVVTHVSEPASPILAALALAGACALRRRDRPAARR